MNIEKSNKLIAEFMEWKSEKKPIHFAGGKIKKGLIYSTPHHSLSKSIHSSGKHSEFRLKFHSSWNWLMPVVEKIESLGYRFEITKSEYLIERFIEAREDYSPMLWFYGYTKKTKLENTYIGVMDFIHLYNKKLKANEKDD